MIVLCVLLSLMFSKVIESNGSDNHVSVLIDYFDNSNSRIGIFYDAELVRVQNKFAQEFALKPKCIGCSNIKSSLKEVENLATRAIEQMNKNDPGFQHELKSILSAQRRILNADSLKYILHTSVEFKNCTSSFGCWSESKSCRIDFSGQLDWYQNSDKIKFRDFINWTCTEVYLPKETFLDNKKMSPYSAARKAKHKSINSNKSSENRHQSHVEQKWKNSKINISKNSNSSKIYRRFRDAGTNKSMLRTRRACPKAEVRHAVFIDPDSSGSTTVDVKSAMVRKLLNYIVPQFNNVTQAGTKYHLDHVINATKKQYIGNITRYVIKFDINNGLEYLHCHSQTLSRNLVPLNYSSNITCLKKNVTAGYHREKAKDPKFREMAQESLMTYDKDPYIFKVRDIHTVKTQVLAGYITYIEFSASPTNCSRRLHLLSFENSCSVTNPKQISHCNTRILMRNWLNTTHHDLSCEVSKAAPSIVRGRKESASLKRFGEDIFFMAMQALDKFARDKKLVYKYKIMDIKTVNKEKISGTLTKIVFDISQTFCASGDNIPIADCNVDESLPVKTCHAEIWDVQLLNDRIINVICHVHNSNTKELDEDGDNLNDGNLGPKLINVQNKVAIKDIPVTESTEGLNEYDDTSPVDNESPVVNETPETNH